MQKILFALLFLLVTPLPAQEPPLYETEQIDEYEEPGTSRFMNEFLNMLVALGLVIGVMFALAWVAKKFMHQKLLQMNESNQIKVLEKRHLSPKAIIYLIEIYGKGVVVGESASGLDFLGNVPLKNQFSSLLEKEDSPPSN